MLRVDRGGVARREGEGAREEGGSRHLGASSRHNKAPGEREDFVPGRGRARLVAVRTGQGGHGSLGAGRDGRCRRAAPRGLRLERGPERGLLAPRAGRGRPGQTGPGRTGSGGIGGPRGAGPGGARSPPAREASGGRSIVREREVLVWRSCDRRAAPGPPLGPGAPQCGPGLLGTLSTSKAFFVPGRREGKGPELPSRPSARARRAEIRDGGPFFPVRWFAKWWRLFCRNGGICWFSRGCAVFFNTQTSLWSSKG